MNEAERKGPSVRVAVLAHARRMAAQEEAASVQDAAPGFTAQVQPPAAHSATASPGFRASVKRRLRPIAGAAYRALKPVLRPIAFRLRAYFSAPLQAQMQGADHAAHARHQHLLQELQTLRNEVAQSVQRQRDEQALIGFEMLQELQLARDSLERTIISAQPEPTHLQASRDQLERIERYAFASARRVAVGGEPGEVLVRTSVGYLLCAASDYPLLATLIDVGELEAGTRQLIQRLVRPGETFVDIGANVGMHTLAAASAMQGRGRIVAFEPHPVTHGLLRKSLMLNGFTALAETHQAAVSNHTGRMPLHLGSTSGHHSLYPLEGEQPAASTVEVPLLRLDDTIAADLPVDLIKIDVEGAELDVLDGAAATIGRNHDIALIVEFGFSHLRRTGHSTQDWLLAFEKFGFAFQAIEPSTGTLLDWNAAQLESVDSINLLFARPASKAWERARGHA
ncbi:FkbM family methyltransferase [Variovorax guangxiensis]|uniref:FkbM family methyltransferase n=1 Tax=Variovorax guangxiensis TaxID=1775474 RepID=UPI00285F258F|nr:FkbM family methyltransferase [Variovorax guangxiensis]MDR6857570.1 FkbM family methyltransferase [Variovorax guangxiensis]